ncbi:MAG: acyl-[acyl-carrier-protein]--UDP-N-acetylglucosamine O-acyltransferase, partial [Gammaproteobacteria bacterium]|nr:acyl-[acyl-carrier-protein]--UDP-N-acetylglucosamine O-acyltransferase [Gammaproteobacteria bacterium]
ATIADDVEIGPWSVIGPDVTIGPGTRIGANVIVAGRTTIGANNQIFQFNSIGDAPQDKKYAGEDTQLVIGDGNTIREFCTINRGTVQDAGVTRIGDDCW